MFTKALLYDKKETAKKDAEHDSNCMRQSVCMYAHICRYEFGISISTFPTILCHAPAQEAVCLDTSMSSLGFW